MIDFPAKHYLFGEYHVRVAPGQDGERSRWYAVVYKHDDYVTGHSSRAPFAWWAAIIAVRKARRM